MSSWLEQVVEAIADRGRELLGRREGANGSSTIEAQCRALLKGQGEASGIALARDILQRYRGMDKAEQLAFFQLLADDFAPPLAPMQAALARYADSRSPADLDALMAAVEPPRQELFRRLNMAPCGTAALVSLRGDLLKLLREHPALRAVDADLKHLLGSWFNRGFLRLEDISWNSPAQLLEKLINYESVHAIQGWDDLRRRLMPDRRCFGFTHPAMPGEPLIFVEVALVQGVSAAVGELLDPASPVLDPGLADTAVFYSINNTQVGLRGISFGNFLIKQVLTELRAELPGIQTFATLSPMPRFAATLRRAIAGNEPAWPAARVATLLSDDQAALCAAAGQEEVNQAFLSLLDSTPQAHAELLAPPLRRLALAYLHLPEKRGGLQDPVAMFHLSNGARMERINTFADPSTERWDTSFGVMVNYLYDPAEVEVNHERFAEQNEVVLSRGLSRLYRPLALAAEA